MDEAGSLHLLAGKGCFGSEELELWRLAFAAAGLRCLFLAAAAGEVEASIVARDLGADSLTMLPLLPGGHRPEGPAGSGPGTALIDAIAGRIIELGGREAGGAPGQGRVELQRLIEAGRETGEAHAPMPASRIALIGLMAAGKTETARVLARLTGIPAYDSDAIVEEESRMRVAEIFSREGESAFRERERRALRGLAGAGPCILSLGGGAVLADENRSLLRRHFTTVWLHVKPETAARRAGAAAPHRGEAPLRPLLSGGDGETIMRRLLAGRRHLYAECADLVISTEGRDPEAVAEAIDAEIGIAL